MATKINLIICLLSMILLQKWGQIVADLETFFTQKQNARCFKKRREKIKNLLARFVRRSRIPKPETSVAKEPYPYLRVQEFCRRCCGCSVTS